VMSMSHIKMPHVSCSVYDDHRPIGVLLTPVKLDFVWESDCCRLKIFIHTNNWPTNGYVCYILPGRPITIVSRTSACCQCDNALRPRSVQYLIDSYRITEKNGQN